MRTDKQLNQTISRWLETEAPAQLPDRVLEATFERTRKTKQRGGWRALLGKLNLTQSVFALGGTAVVVLAATAALSVYLNNTRLGGLPSTPGSWSRVALDTRFATAQVDENSLAVSSRGLLALVGETGSGRYELAFSPDGYEWLTVPRQQHPVLEGHRVELTGTDRGFLMFVDNELWTSADGLDWQHLTGSAEDPDLRQAEIVGVGVGGPGLVAVGRDNEAWYSADGSDWVLADVPPPPSDVFEEAGVPQPIVTMRGVAASGATLVAWGTAEAGLGASSKSVGVLWTSSDGLSWVNVPEPQMNSLTGVAGGPRGFVAIGDSHIEFRDLDGLPPVAYVSSDGQSWERATDIIYEGAANPFVVEAVAAGSSGFVAVGSDGQARVWTSPDGRSWSALAGNDVFEGTGTSDPDGAARATSVAAWGSRFVVAGHYEQKPVIWISGSAPSPIGTGEPALTVEPNPTDVAPEPTRVAATPSSFEGAWVSTDADGSTQTMTISARTSAFEITLLDDAATVCSGTPATMTGNGRLEGTTQLVIPRPVLTCDDGSEPKTLDESPLQEQLRDKTFVYNPASDTLTEDLGTVWAREGADPRPDPRMTASPIPSPSPTPTPISFDTQSSSEDWPSPPRTELPVAPLESSAPVAPGWLRYTDIDADTTPVDVAALDIHTMQIGQGCSAGEPPRRTCIVLTLSGHVDEPRPSPEEAWFGFGIVVDVDRDGAPDYRYGVDNSGRAWRTDLRTGSTVTAPEFDEAMYAEFPPGAGASGGDLPEAIFHLSASGFRFYGWSSMIADGRLQATDYAPDVGWLEVPDVAFAGSWESTDADGSHQTMEVVARSDGGYDLTILDARARVCDATPSRMTGVAERTDLEAIVIAQPEYTCDDGSQAETVSGPPLDELLRNYSLTYDSERDALFDGAGLEWIRAEVTP